MVLVWKDSAIFGFEWHCTPPLIRGGLQIWGPLWTVASAEGAGGSCGRRTLTHSIWDFLDKYLEPIAGAK